MVVQIDDLKKIDKLKYLLPILCLFTIIFCETEATTNEGKKVILNNDGTWKYAESIKRWCATHYTFHDINENINGEIWCKNCNTWHASTLHTPIQKEIIFKNNSVWFNPITTETKPIRGYSNSNSAIPPDKDFCIWVEPDDTEFHPLENKDNCDFESYYIGQGEGLFDSDIDLNKLSPSQRFPWKEGTVFILKNSKGEGCILEVLELSERKAIIAMKWKQLN